MNQYIVIKDKFNNVYGRVEKSNLRNVYIGIDGNIHCEYYGDSTTVVGLQNLLEEDRNYILTEVLKALGEDVSSKKEVHEEEFQTEQISFQPKVLLEELKEEIKDKVQQVKVDLIGLQFLAHVASAVVSHKATKFFDKVQRGFIKGTYKELDMELDSKSRAVVADIYRTIYGMPVHNSNDDYRYNAIKLYCEQNPSEYVPEINESAGTWVWELVQNGESTEVIMDLILSFVDEYQYNSFSFENLVHSGLFDILSER